MNITVSFKESQSEKLAKYRTPFQTTINYIGSEGDWKLMNWSEKEGSIKAFLRKEFGGEYNILSIEEEL